MRLTVNALEDRLTPAAGDLDLAFGTNGRAALSPLSDVAFVQVDDAGRIVVVGTLADTSTSSHPGSAVVRLTAAGQIDPTFGTNGVVPLNPIVSLDGVTTLALEPDGRVVVGGYANRPVGKSNLDPQPSLVELSATGQPVTTFGLNGVLNFQWPNRASGYVSVATRPDGGFIATGGGVARFDSRGRFEPGYGTNGEVAESALTAAGETLLRYGIAPDGGIIILSSTVNGVPAGSSPANGNQLRKLNPSGQPDPTFGTNGVTPVGGVTTTDYVFLSLDIEADGRPAVRYRLYQGTVGQTQEDGGTTYRFQADGSPAPPGSADGRQSVPVVGPTGTLPDGRDYVYFAGQFPRTAATAFDGFAGLRRVTAAGTADATFGKDGFVSSASLGLQPSEAVGQVAVAPDGDALLSVSSNGTLALVRVSGGDPLPAAVAGLPTTIAVGTGDAGLLQVQLPSGAQTTTIRPFADFTGSVRTATADFNRDGTDDIVVGTGPGAASQVQVLDGRTLTPLFAVAPFEASFTGGVYVAAGDLDGDGVPELVVTPDEGGGPRVDVYAGGSFAKRTSFFGIDDPAFRGGARANVGDINGDGTGDLVVAAGFGGGPRVAGFDGKSLGGTPVKVFADFFAFESTLRNGAYVAAGDLDGDGVADLIAGGGPGGGPRVTAFDGKALLANRQVATANFFAGDPAARGGVRVAVKNLNGDGLADLVTGSGDGDGNWVTGYVGGAVAFRVEAVRGNTRGVYVG